MLEYIKYQINNYMVAFLNLILQIIDKLIITENDENKLMAEIHENAEIDKNIARMIYKITDYNKIKITNINNNIEEITEITLQSSNNNLHYCEKNTIKLNFPSMNSFKHIIGIMEGIKCSSHTRFENFDKKEKNLIVEYANLRKNEKIIIRKIIDCEVIEVYEAKINELIASKATETNLQNSNFTQNELRKQTKKEEKILQQH